MFGALSLWQGSAWSPRQYVAKPGDCIVYPQGDPLYDEYYAKNVNVPNCDAQIDQSQSRLIDAQTRQMNAQTTFTQLGLWAFVGIVAFVLVFFVVVLLGDNNNGH
jgi:hypothetical protein